MACDGLSCANCLAAAESCGWCSSSGACASNDAAAVSAGSVVSAAGSAFSAAATAGTCSAAELSSSRCVVYCESSNTITSKNSALAYGSEGDAATGAPPLFTAAGQKCNWLIQWSDPPCDLGQCRYQRLFVLQFTRVNLAEGDTLDVYRVDARSLTSVYEERIATLTHESQDPSGEFQTYLGAFRVEINTAAGNAATTALGTGFALTAETVFNQASNARSLLFIAAIGALGCFIFLIVMKRRMQRSLSGSEEADERMRGTARMTAAAVLSGPPFGLHGDGTRPAPGTAEFAATVHALSAEDLEKLPVRKYSVHWATAAAASLGARAGTEGETTKAMTDTTAVAWAPAFGSDGHDGAADCGSGGGYKGSSSAAPLDAVGAAEGDGQDERKDGGSGGDVDPDIAARSGSAPLKSQGPATGAAAAPSADAENSQDDSCCGICLNNFELGQEIRSLRCDHFFHRGCVDSWFRLSSLCPFCKRTQGSTHAIAAPPRVAAAAAMAAASGTSATAAAAAAALMPGEARLGGGDVSDGGIGSNGGDSGGEGDRIRPRGAATRRRVPRVLIQWPAYRPETLGGGGASTAGDGRSIAGGDDSSNV